MSRGESLFFEHFFPTLRFVDHSRLCFIVSEEEYLGMFENFGDASVVHYVLYKLLGAIDAHGMIHETCMAFLGFTLGPISSPETFAPRSLSLKDGYTMQAVLECLETKEVAKTFEGKDGGSFCAGIVTLGYHISCWQNNSFALKGTLTILVRSKKTPASFS